MDTCTSTSPASLVTKHLSPVLVAPELETQTGEDACCGRGKHVHYLLVPHSLNIRFTTSVWKLHSVVMGWFSRDNRSAITLRQPGMCLARKAIS